MIACTTARGPIASSARADATEDATVLAASIDALDSVATVVRMLGRTHGESVWPGFRPDTIPLLFVLLQRGQLLTGWRGPLPEGFEPVGTAGSAWRPLVAVTAASTSIALGGRAAAQVSVEDVRTPSPALRASLAAVAFHEAFHVLQGASRREGRRFGRGENVFHVMTYPVFDARNDALFALEGRLLADALAERTATSRLEGARRFLAIRRMRHALLGPDLAAFEEASEMNEGLAQYAQQAALVLVAAHGPPAWRPSAAREIAAERARLAMVAADTMQSFRLRYYVTGPGIAALLDGLADSTWKSRMLRDDRTLQGTLAEVAGLDSAGARATTAAVLARFSLDSLEREADRRIRSLQLRRQRVADSVLARPGLLVVLAADSLAQDFGMCGFDPQNHMALSPTRALQARWWKPCIGTLMKAELGTPSVHDRAARTVSAVVGDSSEVRMTRAGAPLTVADGDSLPGLERFRLVTRSSTIEVARADVIRHGAVLTVRIRR